MLQLCDELNLRLMQKIREETKAGMLAAAASGSPTRRVVLDRMIGEFERPGRLAGAGFYEYADGKRTGLWSGWGRPSAPTPSTASRSRI